MKKKYQAASIMDCRDLFNKEGVKEKCIKLTFDVILAEVDNFRLFSTVIFDARNVVEYINNI